MKRATIMNGIEGATLVSLAVLSSAALGGGCLDSSSDCELTNTCASDGSGGAGGAGGQAGSPATGGSGGGTGGQGGAEPGSCVPSENGEGVGVPASCGLFVASGSSGDGSQQSPFGTIVEGLAAAAEAGDRVYVCEGAYVQSVSVPHGVKVYGGLDCGAGWTFTPGDKSTLVGDAHEPAVRLAGDSEKSTILADLRIEAPSATLAGASSIGVLVEGGQLQLENVDVIAGDGAAGEAGTTPTNDIGPTDPNDPAIRGNGPRGFVPGSCNGVNYNEAPEQVNALCASSVGGKGGWGLATSGGTPQPGVDGEVNGGSGGTNTGSLPGACGLAGCCRANGAGGAGSKGTEGDHGAGATGEGTLSTAGWQGTAGGSASRGTPGSGGGGGAGSEKSTEPCSAAGNGGGAGGCGGFGGEAGSPGGGSFAIIVLGGELTTTGGSLVTGNGGDGGDGGDGQPGAVGGNGGTGGVCAGGKGGDGGDGGQGGGGLGGHSIAVAIGLGSAMVGESTAVTVGSAGNGGAGGDAPGQGDDGVAEATYTLDVL